jgi:omega-amidase
METLNVTLIQSNMVWEQPAANLANYNKLVSKVGQTDLIVFPEMFTTGFSMHPAKLKENMDGPTVQWMKQLASRKNAAVTGTLIIEEQGNYYNRCLWVYPNGSIRHYDKHHLFTMVGEHHHYTPGKERLIVEHMGWRICPLVCYDLRFPVWSRNTDNYDVLLYMTSWPAARHHVWKSLLVARAIENQSYCLGVNRVGIDHAGKNYRGDSAFIDFKGFATYLGPSEIAETFKLSYDDLHRFRKVFPVLDDRDHFTLTDSVKEV